MKKYTTMVISESSLKRIIVESIKDTLVEMKGFIDERLFELAGIIYDKCQMEIKNKKYFFDFVVPIETIKRYCPYEIFFPLKIQVGVGITSGLLEYDNHKILINIDAIVSQDKNECISTLAHEMTHFINDNYSQIKPLYGFKSTVGVGEFLNKILYYLRDIECNARCSQFASYLKSEKKNAKSIIAYENITKLAEIKDLLSFMSPFAFILKKQYNLSQNILQKKYDKYKNKIFKIYHHFLSMNQQTPLKV